MRVLYHLPQTMLVLLCLVASQATAQPSPSRAQLARWLERFPEADANGDGTLTAAEALAFRQAQAPASPIERGEDIKPSETDVSYGPHERQVFDFYRAQAEGPTPLIVYIHGGGFVGGDKKSIDQQLLRLALDKGISCAALHYRFVDGRDVIFPTPQHDCARALQFIRAQADKYGIDPQRIACYGGSAGAGISMWLGFHDDLADPHSKDPIARQSTRITAIGTLGGQGTYDPIQIKQLIGGRAWEHPSLRLVYGLRTTVEALMPTPEMQRLYDEASAITHLTQLDPPLFMVYSEPDQPLPDNARPGQGIHHPNFGKQLRQAMDAQGIENIYVHTDAANRIQVMTQMFDFFNKHFENK